MCLPLEAPISIAKYVLILFSFAVFVVLIPQFIVPFSGTKNNPRNPHFRRFAAGTRKTTNPESHFGFVVILH